MFAKKSNGTPREHDLVIQTGKLQPRPVFKWREKPVLRTLLGNLTRQIPASGLPYYMSRDKLSNFLWYKCLDNFWPRTTNLKIFFLTVPAPQRLRREVTAVARRQTYSCGQITLNPSDFGNCRKQPKPFWKSPETANIQQKQLLCTLFFGTHKSSSGLRIRFYRLLVPVTQSWHFTDTGPRTGLYLSFLLSWVSKTQPNYWTKRMTNTRLAT